MQCQLLYGTGFVGKLCKDELLRDKFGDVKKLGVATYEELILPDYIVVLSSNCGASNVLKLF